MNASPTPETALQKIPFKNVDAADVPPCGVMHVTGSVVEDGVAYLTCARPTSTLGTQYAVNGLVRVPAGAKGVCYRQGDLPVAFDEGLPQAGQGWGIRADQWSLSYGYPALVTVHGLRSSTGGILHGKVAAPASVMGVCTTALPRQVGGVPGSGLVTAQVWNGTNFVASQPVMQFSGYNTSNATIDAGTLVAFVESNGLWVAASVPQSRDIWHATGYDPIAAGATGTVVLSDASQVEATNWSDDTDIQSSDRIHVYKDGFDGQFYAIKSDRAGARQFVGALYAPLASNDNDAQVQNLVASDGGTTPAELLTVANTFALAGAIGDSVLIPEHAAGYILKQVEHKQQKVVYDVKPDNSSDTTELEYTWRTTVVVRGEDDHDDTTWLTLDYAEWVIDVKVDNPITKLEKTILTGYAFPTSDTGTDYTVMTTTAVNVVEDVSWDGTNLVKGTADLHYFGGPDDNGANSNVFTTHTSNVVKNVYLSGLDLYENIAYSERFIGAAPTTSPLLIVQGTTCSGGANPGGGSLTPQDVMPSVSRSIREAHNSGLLAAISQHHYSK